MKDGSQFSVTTDISLNAPNSKSIQITLDGSTINIDWKTANMYSAWLSKASAQAADNESNHSIAESWKRFKSWFSRG